MQGWFGATSPLSINVATITMPASEKSDSVEGLHVLVVDDDPGVRGLYVTVLRQAGAHVMSSGEAIEAVELTDLQRPDVVLADLRMPGHDGIWLLGELKARMPAVPVIVVSGNLGALTSEELLGMGFSGILPKPVGLSHLVATVARVAHDSRSRPR